jgi:hypothetical protein
MTMKPGPLWRGFSISGCIDANGKVIDGSKHATITSCGSVWIKRSELPRAKKWGCKAVVIDGGLVLGPVFS